MEKPRAGEEAVARRSGVLIMHHVAVVVAEAEAMPEGLQNQTIASLFPEMLVDPSGKQGIVDLSSIVSDKRALCCIFIRRLIRRFRRPF